MLWLTSTLSTLSRLISKVRRLMKPVLWTTRKLVTSVSVVQRWNQAVDGPVQCGERAGDRRQRTGNQHQRVAGRARQEEPGTRPPRSTPRSPAKRTSSAHWSNTAPSRRAAGFRRYNAPYAQPHYPCHHSIPRPLGDGTNPVACPGRAAMYTRAFGPARSSFSAGHLTYPHRECTRRHGPPRDEIRRHIRRQYRPYPQRRAPCETRGRCRP